MVTTTTVLKKGPWSVAEDVILIDYVRKHGEGNWNSVQKKCGLARCGKSCRLRWANHLRPNLKKGSFTPEEEMLILQLHAQYGNKWARMAAQMPGRTDNEIKNYWNTRIKRRQRAGLPLYPSRMSSARRPPLMVPSSPSSPLQHSAIQQMSSACPSPLMVPSSPSSPLQHSVIQPPPLMVPSSPSSHLQHSAIQQMSSACPPPLMVPSSPSSPLQHSAIQPPPLMVPSSPSSPLQHSAIQQMSLACPPPLMVPASPSSPLQHSVIQPPPLMVPSSPSSPLQHSAIQPPLLMVPSSPSSPLQHSAIQQMSSACPPPMMVPSTPSSPLQHSAILHSPLQLSEQPALLNPLMPESPRVKRIRDDGLTFQFPVGSPYMHQHQPQQSTGVVATTTTTNNMFQYNNNNTYGNSQNFNEMNMNILMSTVLPSTQLSNGGDGGCGLMDALLQDQGGKLVFSDQPPIINENGSNGDDKDLFVDLLLRFEELSCSNGIGMKRKQSELEEANPESRHDNISKLMDMISTPAMPPPPEWQTLTTTDSCEISNGGQPSVVADDELGLELQHLASSLSPADQEWNIGSCPWNNMTGIG